MLKSIRHTGIVVSDMKASLRFYRDLLGMEVWADFSDDSDYVQAVTGVEGADIWMIKMKAGDGSSIELLQYRSHPQEIPPPRRSCDVGVNHIAVEVEDIDALHKVLLKEGFEFNAPPTYSADRGAKVTYCRDPEGVIVELVQLTP
jgi:catechol 2,3-dioxygenase-like lactoylglutathione lyase family enzyme